MLRHLDFPNEGGLRHNRAARETEAGDAKGMRAPGPVASQIACSKVGSKGHGVGMPNESDEGRNA